MYKYRLDLESTKLIFIDYNIDKFGYRFYDDQKRNNIKSN